MDFLQVDRITIEGNEFVTTEDLSQQTERELEGTHMLFVPKKNTLFLPKREIIANLQNSFTEIESASIDRKGLGHIVLGITERVETNVFCQGEICLSFDSEGLLFKEALRKEGEIYFTSREEHAVGDIYLNKDVHLELAILIDSVQKKGLDIVRVSQYSDFTIVLVTKQGTRVLVPLIDSYDDIYSTFVKLLNTEEFTLSKEERDFRSPYAYINMQFGNKIFSCVRGEECENNYR